MIEQKIIKKFISDKAFFRKFHTAIKPNLFTTDKSQSSIIKLFRSFIETYGKFPSKDSFVDYARQTYVSQDENDDMPSFINQMYDVEVIEASSTFELLTIDWIEKQRLHNALVEIVGLTDKKTKNLIGASKKLINNCSFAAVSGIGEAEDMLELHKKYKNRKMKKVISSGYAFVDRVLNGGFHENTVTVIASETNAGKTIMLQNFFINMVAAGSNGLYITYELDSDQMFERMCATLCNMDISELKENEDKVEETIKSKLSVGKPYIQALADGADVSEVDAVIDGLADKGINFDFIVIDYLGCMTSSKSDPRSGLYEKYGNVVEYLKNLAQRLGVPILTASQINRTGYGKDDIDASSMSDSMKIAHKCDVSFFLTKNFDLDQLRCVTLMLDKSRVSGWNKQSQKFIMDKPKQIISDNLAAYPMMEAELMRQSEEKKNNNNKKKGNI